MMKYLGENRDRQPTPSPPHYSYTFIYGKLEDLENFMASFETHPAKKRLVSIR